MDRDIPLDLYKIFCVVVKSGNMSSAAKELFISQPAVSMSIRQLETRMGAPLLVRTTKGVRTTPEGSVLYEYLEQALTLIKTAENKYLEMVNLKTGEIKIGASDTVIANLLMPYLEKYNTQNPKINIKVTNKTTYESLKLLKSGIVDLCFINLPIQKDNDLEIVPFKTVQDCLIGGSNYLDIAKSGIKIKNIDKYPLLLLEDLSNSRRFLDAFAQKNGVVLKPIIELGSSDLLLSFAKINLGLTFAIREFTKNQIDNEYLFEIPVSPPLPKRSIGLVKLKNVALSHAAKSFADMFL
ncbi:MAG TPA: LysR family transcriptional regulator [Lachnospiraceae bacterium]|nr:LysR family transcriptional regulator [Lachnospiraceae bacterium]